MAYLVHCRDVSGSAALRAAALPEHRTYVDAHAERILMSGPLIDEPSGERRGQLFVLDVPDRAAAERFIAADPFARSGVFAEIAIERLEVRFSAGARIQRTGG